MRRCVAALLLGLALLLPLSGCFVFDEIDSGMADWEAHSKKKSDAPPPAAEPAPAQTAGAAPRKNLWEGGRSLDPHEKNAEIARCDLGGGVQFMTRTDCLARGGRPG